MRTFYCEKKFCKPEFAKTVVKDDKLRTETTFRFVYFLILNIVCEHFSSIISTKKNNGNHTVISHNSNILALQM